jgi:hypothetical protein
VKLCAAAGAISPVGVMRANRNKSSGTQRRRVRIHSDRVLPIYFRHAVPAIASVLLTVTVVDLGERVVPTAAASGRLVHPVAMIGLFLVVNVVLGRLWNQWLDRRPSLVVLRGGRRG